MSPLTVPAMDAADDTGIATLPISPAGIMVAVEVEVGVGAVLSHLRDGMVVVVTGTSSSREGGGIAQVLVVLVGGGRVEGVDGVIATAPLTVAVAVTAAEMMTKVVMARTLTEGGGGTNRRATGGKHQRKIMARIVTVCVNRRSRGCLLLAVTIAVATAAATAAAAVAVETVAETAMTGTTVAVSVVTETMVPVSTVAVSAVAASEVKVTTIDTAVAVSTVEVTTRTETAVAVNVVVRAARIRDSEVLALAPGARKRVAGAGVGMKMVVLAGEAAAGAGVGAGIEAGVRARAGAAGEEEEEGKEEGEKVVGILEAPVAGMIAIVVVVGMAMTVRKEGEARHRMASAARLAKTATGGRERATMITTAAPVAPLAAAAAAAAIAAAPLPLAAATAGGERMTVTIAAVTATGDKKTMTTIVVAGEAITGVTVAAVTVMKAGRLLGRGAIPHTISNPHGGFRRPITTVMVRGGGEAEAGAGEGILPEQPRLEKAGLAVGLIRVVRRHHLHRHHRLRRRRRVQ